MGVIDDTGFSILSNTYGLWSRRSGLGSHGLGGGLGQGSNSYPCGCRQTVNNFALANRNLPAIIWCFVNRIRLAMSSRIDVSVPAVGYRAFVFAASRHFVAGNRSTECRGAVSVGASLFVRGDVGKILTVALRECLVSANRKEMEE